MMQQLRRPAGVRADDTQQVVAAAVQPSSRQVKRAADTPSNASPYLPRQDALPLAR